MKRSFVNQTIAETKAFLEQNHFHLPEWADWGNQEWKANRSVTEYINENGLGWDVTDFGFQDFENTGLTLFTLRNGLYPAGHKPYCEKIMHVRKNQVTPYHYHAQKVEDIIFRAGKGSFHLALIPTNEQRQPVYDGMVEVEIDGVKHQFAAEQKITLKLGQSITLFPYLYHKFWAEGADCLIGEVSTINNDRMDNYFLQSLGRYAAIEEDVEAAFTLCNEYKLS